MSAKVIIRFLCDLCPATVESLETRLPDGWRFLDRILGTIACPLHPRHA